MQRAAVMLGVNQKTKTGFEAINPSGMHPAYRPAVHPLSRNLEGSGVSPSLARSGTGSGLKKAGETFAGGVAGGTMIATDQLAEHFTEKIRLVFGGNSDPMTVIEDRARRVLAGHRPIVWEGDAQTFQFNFVGGAAEEVLGYPASRWIEEPTFWADVVVHPDDRNDAVAFCAIATGKGVDHDFQYRARRSDGGIVLLHDIVKVVKSPRGVADRLRGIMIELPETGPA